MSVNLIVHNDPYRPALNMEAREVIHGLTVLETLVNAEFCTPLENGIRRNGAFFVMLNGEPILQKDWNLVLREEDTLQITRLPRGGGGGSNVGNIITAIIVAVAAYFTFGLSLVATVAVGVGTYAAMSLMGSMVPTAPKPNSATGENASSTYSLNAQGNIARLLQAMPRIYGRVKATPDLAANEYSEYEGNEQYLYQLFCISLGSVEVESIHYDDANINDFTDAEYQIINPGEAVTLFPDNVVSSASVNGQTMLAPNETNYSIIGPYMAVPSGKRANRIGVDFLLPQGLGRIDNEGNTVNHTVTVQFEYQEVNDAGATIGNWQLIGTQTITLATRSAQYVSAYVEVPDIRCQVRGFRISPKNLTDNREFDEVQWIGLKAYLSSTYTYGNCTLLAVKARATNQLNTTTARRLTVWAKGLIQTWDAVNGWGPLVYSNNPAWVAADVLRNEDYGRGFPTSRFNVQGLAALATTCQDRGDFFNGVFDTTAQLWDSLTKVLRVCRTTPVYYAGVIDFIRDAPQLIPKAKFQPGNMVANSFETTYNFFEVNTPDHVVVQYRDGETWEAKEVSCALPGETALNPYTVEIIGITNRDHAWREGISMAAANRDRRRAISFTTLTEGLVLKYNALIRISHDVPQWGFSGRVLSFDATTGRLRSSELIPFDLSTTNVISFRKRDGSENGPFVMTVDPTVDNDAHIFGCIVGGTLAERQAIYISDGVLEDNTFYQCGPTERQGLKALVKSVKPDSDGKVKVECMNYADSVYSAENGGVVPPPGPESSLPGTPSAPIVDSVNVVYTVVVGEQNIIATPARGAIFYEYQFIASGSNSWVQLGTSDQPTMTVHLEAGNYQVRVRAWGKIAGPWATWVGTIEATSLPTAKLDTFSAASQLFAIAYSWTFAAESVTLAKEVEVWVGITNVLGNASRLVVLPYPANAYTQYDLEPGERRYAWARVIDTAGRVGSWFNNGVPITQVATNNPGKLLTALGGAITESQLAQELADKINSPDVDLGPVYAEINRVDTTSISRDSSLAQEQVTLKAAQEQTAARVETVNTASADRDTALGQRVDSTLAIANTGKQTADTAYAQTQVNAQSIANTNGDLSAMYTIKTQVTVGGIPYIASIGTGVVNNGGIITSQILLRADTFAMINPNSGAYAAPFIVKGNNTYIASAFIEKATITEALIGATIQSVSLVGSGAYANYPKMIQNFDAGTSQYFGVNIATTVNENGFSVFDPTTGVTVFKAGII